MDPERAGDGADAPRHGKPPPRIPLWASLLSRLPLPAWYALASLLAWLGEYVIPYRREVVNGQLRKCFPELDEAAITRIRRDYYRNSAGVMVEIVKALTMSPAQFRSRVKLTGVEAVREHIKARRAVVLMGSHCCNWEWTLQILALDLGLPVVIPYRPMRDPWADRLLLSLRSRLGAAMIPATHLPIHVMRRRREPMVILLAADQDPGIAGARQVVTFFGQETAFYRGGEAIARSVGAPMYFMAERRTARGCYEVVLEPLVGHDEPLANGAWTERYVRRVEQQIRASPADWLWSYRRWKLHGDAGGNVPARDPD